MEIVCECLGFSIIVLIGALVIYHKKNKRIRKCCWMNRQMMKYPSNGVPSEFFIDAMSRKFPNSIYKERANDLLIINNNCLLANVFCQDGVLFVSMVVDKMHDKNLVEFLRYWDGRHECDAGAYLMGCGCYNMKM